MVWIYTATEPSPVETTMRLGQRVRTINYDIVPLGDNDPSGYKYRHRAVTLEPGVYTYDVIVSALINADYPADKMQAIVNNYLADPTNDDAVEEMLEMQNDRKAAKYIAKQVLEQFPADPVQNFVSEQNDTPPE